MLSFVLLSLFCFLWHLPVSFSSSAAGTETLIGIVGRDFVLLGADSSVSQSIAVTASNLDKIAIIVDPTTVPPRQSQYQQQQTIAAAAAGEAADADRLLGILQAHAVIQEYEASVGCDVELVDCSSNHNNNEALCLPAGLSVEAVAKLARNQIANALRSPTPLRVCLLVAGMMPSSSSYQRKSISATTIRLIPSLDDNVNTDDKTYFASQQVQQQVEQASLPYLGPTTARFADESSNLASSSTSTLLLQPCLYWLDEYGSIQKLKYGAHGLGSHFCLSLLDQGYRSNMTRQQAADLLKNCFQQLRTRYVINTPQPPCIKCIDAEGCRVLR